MLARADIRALPVATESVDLTVTSPPYDNLRQYKGYVFDFEQAARELWRVTKLGGVVVWVVADETKDGSESGTSFRQALGFKALGFNLHDTMIFKSKKPPLTHNRYEQEFEFMFVFSKGRPSTFNGIREKSTNGGVRATKRTFRHTGDKTELLHSAGVIGDTRLRYNVWEYNTGSISGDDRSAHPAPFPERLARDHILSWSNAGDVVLDPMCGSGTTCKMAKALDRRFIGFDIAAEYLAIADRRVAGVTLPMPLFAGMPA